MSLKGCPFKKISLFLQIFLQSSNNLLCSLLARTTLLFAQGLVAAAAAMCGLWTWISKDPDPQLSCKHGIKVADSDKAQTAEN